MKLIESVGITNYRSILAQKVDLEDKTALVGANESGKSNILNALYHLETRNHMTEFRHDEQNISVRHSGDNQITIDFYLRLYRFLVPNLVQSIPQLEGTQVVLTKSGKPGEPVSWSLSIDRLPQFGNLAVIPQGYKAKVKHALIAAKHNSTWVDGLLAHNWFVGGGSVKLNKIPFNKLIRDGKLRMFTAGRKKDKLESLIRDEILKNIQVYFWKYEEENYLKESIDLEDFCNQWRAKKYSTVMEILKIAKDENAFAFELNKTELHANLVEADKTSRANLLQKHIAKQFNKVFNRSWKTFWGRKIELKLNYEGSDLTFRFDDGHECPPEYRSDGFKWFFTFLINFQSKEKSLSNYVLLIDEPGGTLHPRGQKDALRFINKLARNNNQVIYSTHQTFLIDRNNPMSIRILDRSEKDAKHDFYPTKVHDVKDERKHILKDQLLRESLGFTLSDISPINEKNVLVEGTFDRKVLQLCNRKFNVLDMNSVSIIECGKATRIQYAAQQYQASGLKVVCLYDSDTYGKRALDDNTFIREKFKILVSRMSNYTIEDVLPETIFAKAYESVCKKYRNILNKQRSIRKPYIVKVLNKSFKSGVTREQKSEIKHDLEDRMLELMEKTFRKSDYEAIEEKLKEIRELLK